MSLMHLLSASQSLNVTKDGPTRYKMNAQNQLPKFAPVKRPVSLAPAPKAETKVMETPSLFDMPLKKEALPKAEVLNAPAPLAPVVPQEKTKVFSEIKAAQKSFLKRIVSVFRSTEKKKTASVQTEWRLEKVAVVRNDLSDADLEIVAGKIEGKLPPVAQKREKVEQAVTRLKSCFNSVSETVFK